MGFSTLVTFHESNWHLKAILMVVKLKKIVSKESKLRSIATVTANTLISSS